MTCLGRGLYGPVGRIYKAEYYTWLHTKYIGFGPFGFGEDFYGFMGAIGPSGWGHFYPGGMIRKIYLKLQITRLHTKYRSFGPYSCREDDLYIYMYFPL